MADLVADRLKVSEITVGERHRKTLDTSKVDALADSIATLGLLQPIVVTHAGALVAGRHRLEACRKLGLAWIDVNVVPEGTDALTVELAEIDENLVRNELTAMEQGEHLARRKAIYEELYPETKHGGDRKSDGAKSKRQDDVLVPAFAQDAAAKTGKSERTVQRAVHVAEHIPEPVRDAIRETPTADKQSELLKLARMPEAEQQAVAEKLASGSAKTVKDAAREVSREETERRAADLTADPEWAAKSFRLIHADIAGGLPDVADNSVDFIITDPPYPQEYLHTYSALSKLAARVLKPGGSLLAMAGQSYLPEVMALLAECMDYHWTVAYLTPGGQAVQLWDRKVNTFWKPVLWFTKGNYAGDWVGDVSRSAVNDNDKSHHDWGQSESGMADLIERFTKPGDTILDPFVGGGTTAVVAVALARYAIAADVEQAQLDITAGRLAAMATSGRPTDGD